METVVEASDLLIKPGAWPDKITYRGVDYARGKYRYGRKGGRLLHVEYRDGQGRVLLVLND